MKHQRFSTCIAVFLCFAVLLQCVGISAPLARATEGDDLCQTLLAATTLQELFTAVNTAAETDADALYALSADQLAQLQAHADGLYNAIETPTDDDTAWYDELNAMWAVLAEGPDPDAGQYAVGGPGGSISGPLDITDQFVSDLGPNALEPIAEGDFTVNSISLQYQTLSIDAGNYSVSFPSNISVAIGQEGSFGVSGMGGTPSVEIEEGANFSQIDGLLNLSTSNIVIGDYVAFTTGSTGNVNFNGSTIQIGESVDFGGSGTYTVNSGCAVRKLGQDGGTLQIPYGATATVNYEADPNAASLTNLPIVMLNGGTFNLTGSVRSIDMYGSSAVLNIASGAQVGYIGIEQDQNPKIVLADANSVSPTAITNGEIVVFKNASGNVIETRIMAHDAALPTAETWPSGWSTITNFAGWLNESGDSVMSVTELDGDAIYTLTAKTEVPKPKYEVIIPAELVIDPATRTGSATIEARVEQSLFSTTEGISVTLSSESYSGGSYCLQLEDSSVPFALTSQVTSYKDDVPTVHPAAPVNANEYSLIYDFPQMVSSNPNRWEITLNATVAPNAAFLYAGTYAAPLTITVELSESGGSN